MCYENMQLRDSEMIEVFETCTNLGALAQVHAENGDIIAHVRIFFSYEQKSVIYISAGI